MAPGKVSIAWAPGERLLASTVSGPNCSIEALHDLPRPFLNLFFQGHLHFVARGASVLTRSRRYRAAILDCFTSLDQLNVRSGRDELDEDELSFAENVKDAHNVWTFIEALYLSEREDERHVSARLAEWHEQCFPNLRTEASNILHAYASGKQVNEDTLWHTIIRLVAVGDRSLALKLIVKHLNSNCSWEDWASAAGAAALNVVDQRDQDGRHIPFAIAESALRDCPQDIRASRNDGRWQAWQDKCLHWLDSDEIEIYGGVKKFLGFLGGNPADIAEGCTDWQEMLIASCAYGRETLGVSVPSNSVAAVTMACAEASGVFVSPKDIAGGALTEAAMGNPASAIVILGTNLETSWFAAHLCDLLVQAGILSPAGPAEWTSPQQEIGMREFYILEYARGIERYRGMWRIAADYFLECPTSGYDALTAMLSRVNFDGTCDPTIEKLLRLCSKLKLKNSAMSICERLGADCLQQGNYGGAMSWFARSSLTKNARVVANKALERAEIEGPGSAASRGLRCVVVALNGSSDSSLQESLDYLRSYADYQSVVHECRQAKEPRGAEWLELRSSALSLLLKLIGGGGLPRKFWAVALLEASMLIDETNPESPLELSLDVVQDLISALQLVCGPYRSPELLAGILKRIQFDKSLGEDAEQCLQSVRTNFTRALATVAFA